MPEAQNPSREEVDARIEAVEARLDSKLVRIEAKLDNIKVPNVWQMVSVAAGAVVALVSIVAVMADRFDGGLAARSLLDPILASQGVRDAAQDEKLNQILNALEQIRNQSGKSP